MSYAIPPRGHQIQVKNTTNHTISDLIYSCSCDKFFDQPVGKINSLDKKSFMIIDTNLPEDNDLIFHFKNDPDRQFVFEKAVKKTSLKPLFSYSFYKIVLENGLLVVVEDEEAKIEYFKK